MHKSIKTLLITIFTVVAITLGVNSVFAQGNPNNNGGGDNNPGNNIPICHANAGQAKPYVEQSPNADSIFKQGHHEHQDGRDIIPPFDYVDNGETKHFPGLNWDALGQAIHANGCDIPEEVVSVCEDEAATNYNEEGVCEYDEEDDDDEEETPPSPTPGIGGPTIRHGVSFHNSDLKCEQKSFNAVFDVYNYGSPVGNLLVRFSFNGENKDATTNNDGRAQVSYPLTSGTVIAQAEGYGTFTHEIKEPVECQDVYLDPDKAPRRGQVLGATTLADTGSFSTYLAIVAVMAGAMLSSVAGYAIAKES